jgi:hypothetical protein
MFGRCWVSARKLILFPFNVPGSDHAEGRDWINVSRAQEIFLGDAVDIIRNAIKTTGLS